MGNCMLEGWAFKEFFGVSVILSSEYFHFPIVRPYGSHSIM